MRACPIATNYFSPSGSRGRGRPYLVIPSATRFSSFCPMASLTWFQMAANAWSITASVLGSYMSSRALIDITKAAAWHLHH